MTLLDFPERVACTVFLGGCDFRCPFCHNYELVDGTAKPEMEVPEFLSFITKRKGLLDGVAITGGEPCINADLPELLRTIRDLGFATKVDTNGCHPDMLKNILYEGLVDYVAMDVKNSPEKYAVTSGIENVDMDKIYKSINLLKSSDIDYEFRTTVVKEFHERDDFVKIGIMIEGAKRYYLQCFTDRETVPFGNLHAPSPDEMREYADVIKPYVPCVDLRGID